MIFTKTNNKKNTYTHTHRETYKATVFNTKKDEHSTHDYTEASVRGKWCG